MRIEKKSLVYIKSDPKKFYKPRRGLLAMAVHDIVIPIRNDKDNKDSLSKRDTGKLDTAITVMGYNLIMSKKSNRNRLKAGNSERIKSVANVIDTVQKMKATAVDQSGLLEAVHIELWKLYSKVEAYGVDDAHFMENLPCDDRQSFKPNAERGAQGVIFHNGRKKADKSGRFAPKDRWVRIMPDSKYPNPEDQWALLSVTDKMTRSEMRFADVDYSKCKTSKARLTSSPRSHISGIDITIRSETKRDIDTYQFAEYVTKPLSKRARKETMGTTIKSGKGNKEITIGYPVLSKSILPEYESKAAKARRLKAANKAALALAEARIVEAHREALVEDERRVIDVLARLRTISLLASEGLEMVTDDLPIPDWTRTDCVSIWQTGNI